MSERREVGAVNFRWINDWIDSDRDMLIPRGYFWNPLHWLPVIWLTFSDPPRQWNHFGIVWFGYGFHVARWFRV